MKLGDKDNLDGILYSAINLGRLCGYLTEIDKIFYSNNVNREVKLTCGPKLNPGSFDFKMIIWSSIDATQPFTYYIRDKKLSKSGQYNEGAICEVEVFAGKDYPSGYNITLYETVPSLEDKGINLYNNVINTMVHLGFSLICERNNIKAKVKLREDDGYEGYELP